MLPSLRYGLTASLSRLLKFSAVRNIPTLSTSFAQSSAYGSSTSNTGTPLSSSEGKVNPLERRPDDEPIQLDDSSNPFQREPPKCILCRHGIVVDYKNPRLLSQFISSFTGRLYERHITGLCQRQHRKVREAVAESRKTGFMPILSKDPQYVNDPKLFDPMRPQRPNPY